MTKVVTGSFTTAAQDMPVGTVPAAYVLTLTEAGGAVLTGHAALGESSVSIADVPAGTYTGSLQLVDAAGAPLGAAVAAAEPLVVAPDAPTTVSVQVPASLSLSAA